MGKHAVVARRLGKVLASLVVAVSLGAVVAPSAALTPAVDARLAGLDRVGRPVVEPERHGTAVRSREAERLVVRALTRRTPLVDLPVTTVDPRVTRDDFG